MKTAINRGMLLMLALTATFSIESCQKNISPKNMAGNSSVHIYLTDDPSLVFDKLLLDIRQLEIKVEDDDQQHHELEHQRETEDNDNHGDKSGGWLSIPIHPGIYDILRFRNGLDTLFGTGSFPAAHALKKIRLTLGDQNSIVVNGSSMVLTVKDNDRFIVIDMDKSSVDIHPGDLTSIWLDIDGGRSVSRHGNDFEFRANCKSFSREKTGSIEGRVLPKAAGIVVMATNGTDTASAVPESEGEFRFTGLKAGNYSLLFHAIAGGYADSTVQNISVKTGEDTRLATVTLHK